MADLTPAKAGAVIGPKAVKMLAERMRVTIDAIPTVVQQKAPGASGQWLDIDDGYTARHNMDAWGHAERYPKHRWAWRNFTTGDVEEP